MIAEIGAAEHENIPRRRGCEDQDQLTPVEEREHRKAQEGHEAERIDVKPVAPELALRRLRQASASAHNRHHRPARSTVLPRRPVRRWALGGASDRGTITTWAPL